MEYLKCESQTVYKERGELMTRIKELEQQLARYKELIEEILTHFDKDIKCYNEVLKDKLLGFGSEQNDQMEM